MLEVKEVLRLWLRGIPKKRIAGERGLDVKTVRRYVKVAHLSDLDAGVEVDLANAVEQLAAAQLVQEALELLDGGIGVGRLRNGREVAMPGLHAARAPT